MSNITTILDARVVSDKAFTRKAGDTGTITKIRVADNASKKNDRNPARFVNVEAWGALGKQLEKLSKGDIIIPTGELVVDKYTDKQGAERLDDTLKTLSFRVVKSDSFFGKAEAEQESAPETDLPF